MSRVGPLVVFGLTFVVGGMFWALWDGSRSAFDSILVADEYYTLIFFIWRMIPVILLIVGIMCLVSAGIAKARERELV